MTRGCSEVLARDRGENELAGHAARFGWQLLQLLLLGRDVVPRRVHPRPDRRVAAVIWKDGDEHAITPATAPSAASQVILRRTRREPVMPPNDTCMR